MKAPSRPAQLLVINQTDYEWRLAITSVPGDLVKEIQVLARASQTVDLAGGDYAIEQRMLTTTAGPALSRKISSHLEPGQTYRWRLATLLSEPRENSAAP